MTSTPRPPIPWLRIIAEGTAILVSILLAFWIEGWRDNSRTRAEEQLFLTGLSGEIDEAFTELDRAEAYHLRVVDAASRWRNITPQSHADSIADLIDLLTAFASPAPELPSAEALLTSGAISSVSDPALRTWIGSWYAEREIFDRQVRAVDEFARVEVFRYFAAEGFSFESVPRRLLDGDVGPKPERDSALVQQLASDPGLRTLFVQGARMSAVLVFDSRNLRASLEEGRTLLQAVLER